MLDNGDLVGEQGEQGPKGDQGIQGDRGPKGDTGEDGYTPIKGVDYFDGERGPKGDKGDKGDTGLQGEQGEQGPKGDKGDQGVQGETGPKGEQGEGLNVVGNLTDPSNLPISGVIGEAYLINSDLYIWNGDFYENAGSIQGPQGPKGDRGDDGYTPIKGVDYFDGEQGPKGDKGDTGSQGDKGDKGDDGYTPVKGVDYFDGIDGQDGERGPKGDTGEQGPKGDKGDKGDQGISLQYEWVDSRLGIKTEAESDFEYVDLAAATGDIAYTHNQISASREWLVYHNLGKYPSVTVIDSANSVVVGDIEYLNAEELIIRFTSEFSGRAFLN